LTSVTISNVLKQEFATRVLLAESPNDVFPADAVILQLLQMMGLGWETYLETQNGRFRSDSMTWSHFLSSIIGKNVPEKNWTSY
jgi:hypothetical protein